MKKLLGIVTFLIITVTFLNGTNTFAESPKTSIEEIAALLGPPPGTFTMSDTDGIIEIPFEIYRGDIRFDARINGRDVKILIDNGFLWDQLLFFGSSQVDSLNLHYEGEAVVGGDGEGNELTSNYATGITVEFPGLTFYDQDAIVTPKSSKFADLWQNTVGQISAAFFKNFDTEFNFDKGIIYLRKPGSHDNLSDWTEVPLIHQYNNSWAIPCIVKQFEGRIDTVDITLDLGYNDALQIVVDGNHNIPAPERKIASGLGRGIQGDMKGHFGRVETLAIGPYLLDSVLTAFVSPEYGKYATHEFMLGLELFTRFNMAFDYPNGRLYLSPSSNFNNRFSYNMTGLSVAQKGDTLIIREIQANSPAEKAGLTKEHRILKINDRIAGDYTVWELQDLFREEGVILKFTVINSSGLEPEIVRLKLRQVL